MQWVPVTLSDSNTLLEVILGHVQNFAACADSLPLYLISLVTKEVDVIVLVLNILQAVGLVPALREDVKADLAPY